MSMLEVKLASAPSLCTVTSPCRMASPSMSQVTLAGGKEPHVSQRIGVGRPAVSNSFGVTIFTLIGFTGGGEVVEGGKEGKWGKLKSFIDYSDSALRVSGDDYCSG